MKEVFGITGWKNSGKTTLVASLVREFTNRGFKVSTLKHACDGYHLDREGTDTNAHREAGAAEVAIMSKGKWAIMHQSGAATEMPSLESMIEKMSSCDLVILEGFKTSPYQKIECIRGDDQKDPAVWTTNKSIVAIASDRQIADCPLPRFELENVSAIADYIAQITGLGLT